MRTELRLPRRRRGQNATHTSQEAVDAVRVLARLCTDRSIASFLNRNGVPTGRGNRWTPERVTALPSHHGIERYVPEQRAEQPSLNLTEAARALGVSARTLRLAARPAPAETGTGPGAVPWGPQLCRGAGARSHKGPSVNPRTL